MVVLGIDVGLRVTGYVVCHLRGLDVNLIKEGEVKTKGKDLGKRLLSIYQSLANIISQYAPEAVAVERLYSHYRHPTTISLLAQVRGVVLLLAEQNKIPVSEYSPTKARKSFLGKGSVNSQQVKKMTENVLGHQVLSQHTADAFSLVVAYSHQLKYKKLKQKMNIKTRL
jgi:crossover junction endodeoxyribonuclease RuvC